MRIWQRPNLEAVQEPGRHEPKGRRVNQRAHRRATRRARVDQGKSISAAMVRSNRLNGALKRFTDGVCDFFNRFEHNRFIFGFGHNTHERFRA